MEDVVVCRTATGPATVVIVPKALSSWVCSDPRSCRETIMTVIAREDEEDSLGLKAGTATIACVTDEMESTRSAKLRMVVNLFTR